MRRAAPAALTLAAASALGGCAALQDRLHGHYECQEQSTGDAYNVLSARTLDHRGVERRAENRWYWSSSSTDRPAPENRYQAPSWQVELGQGEGPRLPEPRRLQVQVALRGALGNAITRMRIVSGNEMRPLGEAGRNRRDNVSTFRFTPLADTILTAEEPVFIAGYGPDGRLALRLPLDPEVVREGQRRLAAAVTRTDGMAHDFAKACSLMEYWPIVMV